MKIKTRTQKEFKITVNEKEFKVIKLALALMYENDHTHENWIKTISPMMDALDMENSYGL